MTPARTPVPDVVIVGAGTSARELTAAGREALVAARVVVYFGEAVPTGLRELLGNKLRVHPRATTEEVRAVLVDTCASAERVAWVVQGDPTVLAEDPGRREPAVSTAAWLESIGLRTQVLPGISSFSALASLARLATVTSDGRRLVVRGGEATTEAIDEVRRDLLEGAVLALLLAEPSLEAWISGLVEVLPGDTPAVLGVALGGPDEDLRAGTITTIAGAGVARPGVMIVGPSAPAPVSTGMAAGDDDALAWTLNWQSTNLAPLLQAPGSWTRVEAYWRKYRRLDALADRIRRRTAPRVIDVGAGLVSAARFLPGRCTAVDPLARELARLAPWPDDLDLVVAMGESLPFPDSRFDVAISTNMLDHTRDPALVLREIARVLRDDGELMLVCEVDEHEARIRNAGHPHAFSDSSLRRLVHDWEVVDCWHAPFHGMARFLRGEPLGNAVECGYVLRKRVQ